MATYLATVQIGRYQRLEIDAAVPLVGGRSPAAWWRSTTRRSAASREMLELFTRLFGDYPFAGYTVVVTEDALEIPLESQGLSTFGSQLPDRPTGTTSG